MPVRVGINGFGRIGRNVFRAAQAAGADIEWVAVNDLTDSRTLAQLLKYDSILGPYPGTVEHNDEGLVVDGTQVRVLAERDPGALPWGDLGADVVIESREPFRHRSKPLETFPSAYRHGFHAAIRSPSSVTIPSSRRLLRFCHACFAIRVRLIAS